MDRRRLLATAGSAFTMSVAGCARPQRAFVPGRIDRLGHTLPDEKPAFTFGHVSADGEWGVMGSFPTSESSVASTLFDLSSLDDPRVVHQLESADAETRTNDVKFDALREGLYYRSQETNGNGQEGFEVVDFGWDAGSPGNPRVLAAFEAPNTGVHKLTTHPDAPLVYVVDTDATSEPGVITVDVSEPNAPEVVDSVGPAGFCHDVEYDAERAVLHAAYILGPAEGYVIYDASDPRSLEVLGHFEYADEPDYAELGTPGFERCHQAHVDSERDIAIIGDEVQSGVPGGKHLFDIGWRDGSLEDPQPIGFTHSPDAREMGDGESFWWTTHFHDVVYDRETVLLVDGGYRQGAWVCNITDPERPTPTERYATVDGFDFEADERAGPYASTPPFAWGAVYNDEREFVFVTDSVTGAYTFEVTADPARGENGRGPDGHYDKDQVLGDTAGGDPHDH